MQEVSDEQLYKRNYIRRRHLVEEDDKSAIFGSNSYNAIKNLFEPRYNDINGGVKKLYNDRERKQHLVDTEDDMSTTTSAPHHKSSTYLKEFTTEKCVIRKSFKESYEEWLTHARSKNKYLFETTPCRTKNPCTTRHYTTCITTRRPTNCHTTTKVPCNTDAKSTPDDNKGTSKPDVSTTIYTDNTGPRETSRHTTKHAIIYTYDDWWARRKWFLLKRHTKATSSKSVTEANKITINDAINNNAMLIAVTEKAAAEVTETVSNLKLMNHIPFSNLWNRRKYTKARAFLGAVI